MKAFLKRLFKKLWQILVRIFSCVPYIYTLEQVYDHEHEKAHELEDTNGDEQPVEQVEQNKVNVGE